MYRGAVSAAKPLLGLELTGVVSSWVATRGWNSNPYNVPYKFLKPKVKIENLNIKEPVSGSVDFKDMGSKRIFDWTAETLNKRGFLRYQKEYEPPEDAKGQILEISASLFPQLGRLKPHQVLEFQLNTEDKFKLLSKAFSRMNHSVPNSMLYMMHNIGHVVDFYTTPIKTTTPFDELVRTQDQLPPNLHVQKEAIRFHPDTDTKFDGMTAFPKRSVIVTGLRAKKKYKGFEAKKSWP